MRITSIDRELTLQVKTRKIARQIEEKLLEWVLTGGDTTLLPAINTTRAEELSIKLLFGLTDDEMENITEDDYIALKVAIAEDGEKKRDFTQPVLPE